MTGSLWKDPQVSSNPMGLVMLSCPESFDASNDGWNSACVSVSRGDDLDKCGVIPKSAE